jgi:hypothetical protein
MTTFETGVSVQYNHLNLCVTVQVENFVAEKCVLYV